MIIVFLFLSDNLFFSFLGAKLRFFQRCTITQIGHIYYHKCGICAFLLLISFFISIFVADNCLILQVNDAYRAMRNFGSYTL